MTVPHVLLAEQSFVDLAAFGDTDKARGNLRNPILRSCRVAATANVASLSGTTTIDGKALVDGDPALLTAQTTGSQNGPWVVHAGAWTRPGDYTAALGAMTHARSVLVWDGNTAANKGLWTLSTVPTTVDTTATTWTAPPTGSGGGSSFNQTVQVNGTSQTQRGAFNFIAGANTTITPADNAGAARTDLTFAFSGGGTSSPDPQPGDNNLLAWSDVPTFTNTAAPSAGVLFLAMLPVRASTTFANMAIVVATAGSGATSLANCFMGLYVKSGANLQLIGSTSDLSTTFGSLGLATPVLTVQGGQSLTQSVNVWAALLIGTQSTTPVKFNQSPAPVAFSNAGLVVGTDALKYSNFSSGLSALPATVAIASTAANASFWMAAK